LYTNEAIQNFDYDYEELLLRDDIERKSNVFKALSDPNRLKLIYLLMNGEKCVSELLPFFEILQPTVSVHLILLQETGFLKVRRDGRKRYYSLSDDGLLVLIDGFCENIFDMKRD
jgi:ArsR family transcriptional regulator